MEGSKEERWHTDQGEIKRKGQAVGKGSKEGSWLTDQGEIKGKGKKYGGIKAGKLIHRQG